MKIDIFRNRAAALTVVAVLASAGFQSCHDGNFHVDGAIDGAKDSLIVLQRADFSGRWVTVDSARGGDGGSFVFKFEAPATPEIFRVGCGGKYVYLPVDSTERLNVSGTLATLATGAKVSGSEQAERLARFEREAAALKATDEASREAFKRRVFTEYIQDRRADAVSYYVLGKEVGGSPLFSVNNPKDAKYYSAVATAFVQYRPTDPRTEALKQTALKAQQARNRTLGRQTVVQAGQTSSIDIILPDVSGTERSLSQQLGKGRPTVVIFSVMTAKESPAINRLIADIYNKGGVEVYQVCLDSDRTAWREAAKAIPWTCVFDPDGSASAAARAYNVTTLPAAYIYNSRGELVARAESFADLERKLSAM